MFGYDGWPLYLSLFSRWFGGKKIKKSCLEYVFYLSTIILYYPNIMRLLNFIVKLYFVRLYLKDIEMQKCKIQCRQPLLF